MIKSATEIKSEFSNYIATRTQVKSEKNNNNNNNNFSILTKNYIENFDKLHQYSKE